MDKKIASSLFLLLLGLLPSLNAADVHFQTKSPTGIDNLNITLVSQKPADAIAITMSHKETSSACNFELLTNAKRKFEKGSPDDFNEALPNGTWVTFANYEPDNETISELSVDVSSKSPRFASIALQVPASYDTKKCLIKNGYLEVLFFK
ncbi:MAG: hypothetical protein PHQ90_06265 [Sulfuricurvum sp.]|uniref:hypothetical protein n=1 Tax=Sulfuricurvum sp. TaxID=2025608 RepID=UPI002633FC6D|nr:hypothetical protein [Sulfuricurvum sp.]MDD2368889.1 hypothetical protein [Sulfuricurvum sp.]MDD2949697.1 hypothetical protein [Sulfuricurvum sp.]MDD5118118.1 hypothetical protein [Sulfuricurvum sp.]